MFNKRKQALVPDLRKKARRKRTKGVKQNGSNDKGGNVIQQHAAGQWRRQIGVLKIKSVFRL